MRTLLNKKLNTLELLEESRASALKSLEELVLQRENTEKAHKIMQAAAKISQKHLAEHLSVIATQAIRAVIHQPFDFVCEFVERRGSTEADLYLTKDGHRFEILSSLGGGLADVISLALKVAYLLLSNVDKVLIIDEPARHINDINQRKRFVEVLAHLSSQFDIQFILVSTLPELLDVADNVVHFELNELEKTVTRTEI